MSELVMSGDTRMTAREVALGVDNSTVCRIIQRLYPELVQNGKTTYLNEVQVTAVKGEIGSGRTDLCNVAKVKDIVTSLDIERMTVQVIEYHVWGRMIAGLGDF